MMPLFVFLLASLIFVSGCFGDVGEVDEPIVLDGVEFQIMGSEYQIGDIITLNLKTNDTIENARIEIISEEGKILCTKYNDLGSGITEIEMENCEFKEEITISVAPPGRGIITKKAELTAPELELKEGYKYSFITSHCKDCTKRDSYIYVTEETDSQWEGISAIKTDKTAFLIKWIIDKESLDIKVTETLNEKELSEEAEYTDISVMTKLGEAGESMIPFWMIILRDMYNLNLNELISKHKTTLIMEDQQQTAVLETKKPEISGNYKAYILDIEVFKNEKLEDSGEFIVSSSKPYLIIDMDIGSGPRTTFKKIERKEFSTDDFEGYNLHKWVIEE